MIQNRISLTIFPVKFFFYSSPPTYFCNSLTYILFVQLEKTFTIKPGHAAHTINYHYSLLRDVNNYRHDYNCMIISPLGMLNGRTRTTFVIQSTFGNNERGKCYCDRV
jgi:hypothetical protein